MNSASIGLEPAQTGVDRSHQGFAAVAGDEAIGVRLGAVAEFGREHEIFAPALQPRAKQLLGLAELVDVCRVDEIAARFRVGIEDGCCDVGIGAVSSARAEVACAEGQLRHPQARLAEVDVVHCRSNTWCSPCDHAGRRGTTRLPTEV